jgi:transposase
MKQSPYRTTGASNGVAEGINLLIKKIKRVGQGFRNFRQLPAHLLSHCGVE